jgi:hypothetical protein
MDGAAVASIVVASIAAAASIVSARYAGQNKKSVKTSNGHTLGEIVESLEREFSKLRDEFIHHLLDSDVHQKVPPPDVQSRYHLWSPENRGS